MLRLGLIGCGNMGDTHRRGLEQLAGRARVVATVDLDEARAHAAAQMLGAEMATSEYRRILDRIDAAVVALPHHLHHPVGLDLLEAGVHVLMEKPLAISEAQCLDLIRAAEVRNLTLMVAYIMRFHPLLCEMERLIVDKVYGPTFQLSIWTEQHTQREPGSWHHRIATLGGGQLFSHGCHYIDILLAWMGEPVEGVHLGTNRCTPWMEAEGTSNVTLRFESGALGYHFGTWGARGSRLRYSFHAHCEEAMLEAQVTQGRLILRRGASEDGPAREEVLLEAEQGKQTERELAHFVTCVESGARPLTDARRSLQSLRVIWRLYEAERLGVVADLRGLGLGAAGG
ncbi:MAG: Gfo/Idh/MocA family oxidoreductase [Anaerolineae bacterium]|nr:Gfo/Idh/MocA family oxidoreductase [Anaerolineae bacterium]